MIVHAVISMAMAMAVSVSVPMGLSVRMAVAPSVAAHPVALHGAAVSVARAPRLCLGLHLGLATSRGLSVAQFLRPPFDFGHARRIGAFTNTALGSLRECSRGRKQQRQHGDGYTVNFHDALSLTGDGLLSDKSANWFLSAGLAPGFRDFRSVWHNAASFQEAWPSG